MRRKKESEYHTGRLNISCPPSVKDAIAADATRHDMSISQYIVALHEKSAEAGTPEHLARIGLDLLGMKKKLLDIDTRLRRSLVRSQNTLDPRVAAELANLRVLEARTDETLRETIAAVKALKAREAGE